MPTSQRRENVEFYFGSGTLVVEEAAVVETKNGDDVNTFHIFMIELVAPTRA